MTWYLFLSLLMLPMGSNALLWFLRSSASGLGLKTKLPGGVEKEDSIESDSATTFHCWEASQGLSKRQLHLCRRYPQVVGALEAGVRAGLQACQSQFARERWNCSTHQHAANAVLQSDSREAAYLHAIGSAGVVVSLAKACAKGHLRACGCAPSSRGISYDGEGKKFAWGGCGDNIAYAAKFARKFLDPRGKERSSPTALASLHNGRAGRKSVKKLAGLACKCHGVSGACTTRTCWTSAPPLPQVAALLHQRYRQARHVKPHETGKGLLPAAQKLRDSPMKSSPHSSSRHLRGQKRISGTELVFLSPSPDFCVPDPRSGSLGTAGRKCNESSTGPDSCPLLCCGRGWSTRTEIVEEQCECKFVWCCEVVCKSCSKAVTISTCNGDDAYPSAGHFRYQVESSANAL